MMEELAIEVNNITKIYKLYEKPIDRLKETFHPRRRKYNTNFYALKDVNFSVNEGDTIGIIGKNGSGKSTLLKLITGVLTPSAGNVKKKGVVSALLELGAGFNPEMTGIENIYMNGTLMGYSREEMEKKIDKILEFADIGEFIYQQVKTYSSGMFVRLAFSVAISVDPDIFIIDEALSVGDMYFQLKCVNKIKELKKEGKTIIFVSHDIYTIRNICSTVLWFNEGSLVMNGNCEDVIDSYEKFMKKADFVKVIDNKKENIETKIERNPKIILEIEDVRFLNKENVETKEFENGDDILVEVKYEIFKEIENIVAGIAIFDSLGSYVCGLNTKLDEFKIENAIGKHKFILTYNNIKLLTGIYYIDIGFYEDTAVAKLDYKAKYKSFVMNSKYSAEGLFLLDHEWHSESI
ncbi:MAG: ABC transporter ATP-binding protein, partial [Clostridiales bacterium]